MDIAGFNRLFKQYKEPFTAFAGSYVRDEMAAEDIYMDSMLQYWEKGDSLPDDTNVPAYILTIVKNKALNYLRHQLIECKMMAQISSLKQRELSMNIFSLEACNPEELFADNIRDIMSKSLNTLSENTRNIFYLSRFSDLTNKEIASRLHMTEKGVEYHMSRALKTLRKALKDYLPLIAWSLCMYLSEW